MPGWSPYGLPGKCEVKNAGSVRTFELYLLPPFYLLETPEETNVNTFPAFSIYRGNIMGLIFFLIGVAVIVVDFLLGDPIDWWMVILAFLSSFLSLVVFSDVWND